MYEQIPPCLHYTPDDHIEPPSCLDSAYEREAIEQGFAFSRDSLFPENKIVYDLRQARSIRS